MVPLTFLAILLSPVCIHAGSKEHAVHILLDQQPLIEALAKHALIMLASVPVNDEGASLARSGMLDWQTLYCGRILGHHAIPGSDGRCGPDNGPQCGSCARYQALAPQTVDSRFGDFAVWCSTDSLAKCRALLARGDIDLELRDGKLKTALMWAVDNRNIDMTRELVKAGADVNDRRGQLREKNQKYKAAVRAEGAECTKSDIECGETTAKLLAILEGDDTVNADDTEDADDDAASIDVDDDTAQATGTSSANSSANSKYQCKFQIAVQIGGQIPNSSANSSANSK